MNRTQKVILSFVFFAVTVICLFIVYFPLGKKTGEMKETEPVAPTTVSIDAAEGFSPSRDTFTSAAPITEEAGGLPTEAAAGLPYELGYDQLGDFDDSELEGEHFADENGLAVTIRIDNEDALAPYMELAFGGLATNIERYIQSLDREVMETSGIGRVTLLHIMEGSIDFTEPEGWPETAEPQVLSFEMESDIPTVGLRATIYKQPNVDYKYTRPEEFIYHTEYALVWKS